mmetsp:Transcript_4412/g.6843  ORF Transcript_4412/g.6843 Transcript_4412/m.6843 type:complete len:211 (-) Transcript_4412:562-1194(-)
MEYFFPTLNSFSNLSVLVSFAREICTKAWQVEGFSTSGTITSNAIPVPESIRLRTAFCMTAPTGREGGRMVGFHWTMSGRREAMMTLECSSTYSRRAITFWSTRYVFSRSVLVMTGSGNCMKFTVAEKVSAILSESPSARIFATLAVTNKPALREWIVTESGSLTIAFETTEWLRETLTVFRLEFTVSTTHSTGCPIFRVPSFGMSDDLP